MKLTAPVCGRRQKPSAPWNPRDLRL